MAKGKSLAQKQNRRKRRGLKGVSTDHLTTSYMMGRFVAKNRSRGSVLEIK
jgi:hypothetical protein